MTPPAIIILIALVTILSFIAEWAGWNKVEPTTQYDSPKDDLYHEIGQNLTYSDSIGLQAEQSAIDTVEFIEETNTYVWDLSKAETIDYM